MSDIQLLEIPEQIPSSEVDEEILEIFIEEVEEVLQNIVTHFEAWKTSENDLDSLADLRRAFHTLKGSGRMVGAMVIGEFGWQFEYMLNQLIDGILSKNDDILSILAQVETILPSMLQQFQQNQPPSDDVILLISQAHTLTSGVQLIATESPVEQANENASEMFPCLQLIEIPEQISSSEIDEEILEIFMEEVEEVLQNIVTNLETWKNVVTDSDSLGELRRAFHTLKGSGRMEGSRVIGEFGWQFENMLNKIIDGTLSRNDNMLSLLEQVEKVLPSMLEQFQKNTPSSDEVILLISQASYLTSATFNKEQVVTKNDSITLNSDDLSTDDSSEWPDLDDFSTLPDLDDETSDALNEEQLVTKEDSITLDLNELTDNSTLEDLSNWPDLDDESVMDDLSTLPDLDTDLADWSESSLEDVELTELPEIDDSPLIEMLDLPDEKTIPEPVPQIKKPPENIANTLTEEASDDDFQEIIDLFLEESEEIVEKTQSLLGRWMAAPDNKALMSELQRELHTLKGGANMVGITAMADLSHSVEDLLKRIVEGTAQFNSNLQDTVQECVDELSAMREAVRSGVPLEMPIDLINQINAALGLQALEDSPKPVAPKPITASPETKQESENKNEDDERIKVRVSLVDKLTNLAGELSISRAHMEQQQGEIKNHLEELEQTVIRLREQTRRLNIESEAQIQSHYGNSRHPEDEDDENWDPLFMDRFNSANELSRFLEESVNDLASIQDSIKKVTRQSDLLLIQQSRIGAELQDGIMRARMIPFSKVTNKFQTLARQTARKLGKPVDFIINGETIEFEKTVLDTVVTALEHMLRNGIDHGIEDAQTRQQAGKPRSGKIVLDVSNEGAEIIIKLNDDGAGLNLSAIRRKAEKQGMIKAETVISDHDLRQFILKPGFSTASQVTQVSGRGVGMDVAISQIKDLGGNLLIHSKMGEGSTFEIRLPVSLTITQALLVHIGEETMAVPINYLDAVMRTPRSEVVGEQPDEERYYKYMDTNYRVFQLGKLLGLSKTALIDSPGIPTLLVHAAGCHVALLVDTIEGSKEIVVKAVGPQIGAIRWIAGATILGDGRVVLILDVPTILREENTLQYKEPITEFLIEEKIVTKKIMVVDDSITVRKVTAGLLKRQQMEVLTAKDGLDAVSELQNSKVLPDLILLDVEMPRMDGYEFATIVRSTPDWKHLPIIMITSRMGAKHSEKAKRIGVNRYLGKPYKDQELLENINALLVETEASPN